MGSMRKEFTITTDMPWEEFQKIASTYLGGGATQLCCRTIKSGEGSQECLVALRENQDWVILMVVIRQYCASGDYKELQIVNVRFLTNETLECPDLRQQRQVEHGAHPSREQHEIRLLQLSQYPGLSDQLLDLERHPFEYPTIQELLQQLDASETQRSALYISYLETLHRSWMMNVDELTMISERDLFVASGIPPGKIRAIYAKARRMMLGVQIENREAILEMVKMRREWNEGQ
jgi:hypothetical protein